MSELEECEQKLVQAAEFGKMLLQENEELKNRLDDIRTECDKKLEETEQKVHTVQVKLEQKCSMEAWYNEEIGHLKQQVADRNDHVKDTLEAEKHMEVGKLNRQINELRADLDHQTGIEAQLKQKICELDGLLQERLNQTDNDLGSRSFGLSEEVVILQEEVATLQTEVTCLKGQLIDKRAELGSVVTEIESLRGKIHARDEELEDIKCQFTTVNNSLEQARMEKLDLKCQLDALHMENNSHKNKGNSIFSELDDRRIDAEKKLISLKVSNETLAEKYNEEKLMNKRYKRQISHLLLETTSGRIDSEYVTNLETRLTQARQELKTLLEERELNQQTQASDVPVVSDKDQVKMASSEYTQYLVTVIESKEQEIQKIKKENSMKSLQLLDLKVRTSGQDSRLVQLEADKAKLHTQSVKLLAKLQELRLKYEPDTVKASGALVVKRTEKIPLDDPDDVKITETSRIHDKSTINQSQLSLQAELENASHVKSSKPLVETCHTDNIPVKSALSKCVKTKTVSISDEIEEQEIENVATATKSCSEKQRGRTLTAVKHIKNPDKVNECKSQ